MKLVQIDFMKALETGEIVEKDTGKKVAPVSIEDKPKRAKKAKCILCGKRPQYIKANTDKCATCFLTQPN